MPLYEYECEACGHRFEVIQKLADAPVATCSACGGAVHKLQSAPAFQFKGSGWYVTDYARKGAGKSEGASQEAKPAAAGKGESGSGKSESAPSAADSGSKNAAAASGAKD
jgi:putative FmdB family regulatory protein